MVKSLLFGTEKEIDINMENVTFFYDHFDDDTIPEELRRSLSVRVISSVFTLLVGVVSIVGNSAVVFVSYEEAQCAFDWRIYEVRFFSVPSIVVGFYIPGLFMIICNALVISTALKWERKKVFVMRMNESSENNENMKKTIITTLVLVITYYVCVSPYVVSKNVYILTGLNIPPLWNIFCTVLFYMSSAVNPFIYAILRKDYTAAFKTIPRMLSQRFF
ncbi:motilin receptor-like [Uloborus diversus]|uniref:motilin receptor-like n=1 Tax=Uloborus diversus TaxID=327109 RepID=UPI00240913DD|nr:motilin receptor-like [Uloborus diversus]